MLLRWMYLLLPTFFALDSGNLRLIRHNVMALVHYGFSREEALWMPIPELHDYIQLINEQVEEENEQMMSSQAHEKEAPTSFGQAFGNLSLR